MSEWELTELTGPDGKKSTQKKTWGGNGGSFSGLLTKGLFVFIAYLFIIGVAGWSDQIKWLIIIGLGIWVLMR